MRTILGVILFVAAIATPSVVVFKEAVKEFGFKEFLVGLGVFLVAGSVITGLLLLAVWLITG